MRKKFAALQGLKKDNGNLLMTGCATEEDIGMLLSGQYNSGHKESPLILRTSDSQQLQMLATAAKSANNTNPMQTELSALQ